ncbi:MAG: c-type cytochrome domain-containing protein, partial [Pirellulales bacterium]
MIAASGIAGAGVRAADDAAAPPAAAEVSYYKQVRPLLQANCQGCHQPAKAGGLYVMTDFSKLVAGGETGDAAIVPGNPDGSALVTQITPVDGQAAMPKGKTALGDADIKLIRDWIAQGAKDDTPANAVQRYDAEHPPVYSRQPVITAIDYSPDGQLLAVAGFHEVLLHKADGSGVAERLIGLSERIESVRFSPDGKRLAVTGGLPCRMGELQIWNLEAFTLELSIPITSDTVYGASWSPDGTLVAIGCADKSVRGFNPTTGEQVFFSGAHDDWVQDTVFSTDGAYLLSVGRDMSTKLYDVKTQRFIDNVTSITPGALKGGLSALARHPARDEVLVGSSDGVPRIYRMQRLTKRVIGDDANLIRKFPAMRGRVFSVDYSPDGKQIVAASSLDGKGQVFICAAEFDPALPEEISAIVQKVGHSAEEAAKLEAYLTADVKLLAQIELPVAVYAVAFSPDGNSIAAAGADGILRIINPADGTIVRETPTVTVDADSGR